MLLIGAALQFFLVPLVGALSDRVGRRPLYLAGAVGVGIWGFVFFGAARHQRARAGSCWPSWSGCSSTR